MAKIDVFLVENSGEVAAIAVVHDDLIVPEVDDFFLRMISKGNHSF